MQSVLNQVEVMRILIGLLLVLLLIMGLSWVVKKLHSVQLGATKGFQLISSMILGPKEKIILLKVGERYLLLGSGSGHITLLHDFGEQMPVGFDAVNKFSFSELLRSVVKS